MRSFESLESRTLMSISGLPIRIGGDGFDMGKRVSPTPDGGFIAAGLFTGTVDFDPTSHVRKLTAKGDSDIYVAKYTSAGRLQWVRQIGGSGVLNDGILNQDTIDIASDPRRAGGVFLNGVGSDPKQAAEYINDIQVTADGGVVLGGAFYGQVDFDPGAHTRVFANYDRNYPNAFVVKLNASGNLAWADQFGGRFTDVASSLSLDASGNLYVGGFFSRDVDFVPGNSAFTRHALGRNDGFSMKLSSAGKVRWVSTFGGDAVKNPFRDAVNDIAVDSAGNVYAVGNVGGSSDLDPTHVGFELSSKRPGGILIKYNSSGRFLSFASYASERGYSGLTSVAVDSNDNVLIGGYFEGTLDADPGAGQRLLGPPLNDSGGEEFTDGFVAKLNGSLRLQWAQQLAGTGVEFIDQIQVDSSDNVVVGGSYYGIARFGARGPTSTSVLGVDDFNDSSDNNRKHSYDAYVWKLTGGGATAWVRSIGQAGDDFGAGIGIGSDDSILFTGRYRGTTDFDPGPALHRLRGAGLADGFVTQFLADGTAGL